MATRMDNVETVNDELRLWWRDMARGQVVACVRGRVKVESAAKWLQTALRKRRFDVDTLNDVLSVVERESVEPFMGSPWNEPARVQRFDELRRKLAEQRGGRRIEHGEEG